MLLTQNTKVTNVWVFFKLFKNSIKKKYMPTYYITYYYYCTIYLLTICIILITYIPNECIYHKLEWKNGITKFETVRQVARYMNWNKFKFKKYKFKYLFGTEKVGKNTFEFVSF